jgi:general secretion pathway protein A
MTGTTAKIEAADNIEEIELAQLALQSHNDFTILWRSPKNYTGPVRPGHHGAIIQTLAEKSAQAQNMEWIGTSRSYYDASLKEQVKSFQRTQGLTPDGVAGPQTWIRMNSLTEENIPTLQLESEQRPESLAQIEKPS